MRSDRNRNSSQRDCRAVTMHRRGWTRTLKAACIFLALAATAFALNPPSDGDSSDAFAGTWQAQFQGKTFLSLTLSKQDGKLAGTISHSTFQLDNNGELTSAEQKDGQDAAADLAVDGQVLRFSDKDERRFEMDLTAADEADLKLLTTPSDSAAAKPWKLTRVPATAASASTKPTDIKSKLAAAAQSWLAGQFGTGTSQSTASDATTSSGGSSSALSSPAASLKVSDAPLDSSLRKSIDNLPRRVHDQFNNQGDMVNFALVGSLEQVQAALDAASWHAADTDDKQAALNAVLATYQKKDYLAMPMSTLYLFDRRQDYGYEEADPYAVVATRHHFRIWKTAFTYKGQPVWVGAGTHDIGFEKDQRNGNVTHKIDPAVDGERDNIGQTLQQSGKVESLSYYLPSNPVQDARNATGGGYHSDGRILVIFLK